MMVANSSNLIITVKPANQRTLTSPRRGSFSRNSQLSSGSHHTNQTNTSDENEQDEQDEVVDLTGITLDDHNNVAPQPQQSTVPSPALIITSQHHQTASTASTASTIVGGSESKDGVLHL